MTDDKLMVDRLNQFYCSVFTQEDIADTPAAENIVADGDALEDITITEEKVKDKLRKLRPDSAPGPDKLWPRVLQIVFLNLLLWSTQRVWVREQFPQTGSLQMLLRYTRRNLGVLQGTTDLSR